MRPKLLLDEDSQAKQLFRLLAKLGYDVESIASLNLNGSPDTLVLETAKAQGRVLVTRNCRDFALLHRADSSHPGIFLIYPVNDTTLEINLIVRGVENISSTLESVEGQLHVVNQWAYTAPEAHTP